MSEIVWLDDASGEAAWRLPLDSAGIEAILPLSASPWRPSLPAIALGRLDGGEPVDLATLGGKVVVLEFWASWCAPCVAQLPRLQALARTLAPHGVVAFTVNGDEPSDVALEFARSIGLELPVLTLGNDGQGAFQVDRLPTLIVADRSGRIRGRWTGLDEEQEVELASLLGRLIREDADADRVQVAEVVAGSGELRAAWTREGPSPVEGLAVVPGDDGDATIMITSGRYLVAFAPRGDPRRQREIGSAAGHLRRAGSGLLSFRRGGTSLVFLERAEAEPIAWDASAPVLDAAVLSDDRGAPLLLLGTIAGLVRTAPGGADTHRLERFGEVRAVSVFPPLGSVAALVLGAGGELRWVDRHLAIARSATAPTSAFSLFLDASGGVAGVGLAPADVVASAVGRFLGDSGSQVAFADAGGWLRLVDLDSGAVRWQARWREPVSHLAAKDLDQDGRDELVVASGRRLTLLREAIAASGP